MYCPTCGSRHPRTATSCADCGVPLRPEEHFEKDMEREVLELNADLERALARASSLDERGDTVPAEEHERAAAALRSVHARAKRFNAKWQRHDYGEVWPGGSPDEPLQNTLS